LVLNLSLAVSAPSFAVAQDAPEGDDAATEQAAPAAQVQEDYAAEDPADEADTEEPASSGGQRKRPNARPR